jgi:hypothetical protein
MHPNKRLSLFSLALISAMLMSAILPLAAYADDGAPPADPGTETGPVDLPPVEETDEEPVAPTETEVEEPVSLPEILEQAPEGTEVVVLDENSEPLPLVTEEAAGIIVTGDPMWCPDGQTPGTDMDDATQDCTDGFSTFNGDGAADAGLLSVLSTVSGNGTIYIANDYDYTLEQSGSIVLNGSALTLSNLVIQGGWDFTGDALSGTSNLGTVSLEITNWTGSVTLNDLVSTADNTSAALTVDTTGNIIVDNVSVTDNATGSGAELDSCQYDNLTGLCTGSGDITVSNSTFDDNNFNGLVTDSAGNTTLTNVQADNNGLNGAQITGSDEDGTGDVTVTGGSFSNNDNGSGLDVLSDGSLTLTNVIADYNNVGALLDVFGDITLSGGSYNYNDFDGIEAWSAGNISLSDVDASLNTELGAYLDATYGSGSVTVDNFSTFTGNGEMGLLALTADGDITLQDVTVDGLDTTWLGAWLKSFDGGDILVQDSTFTQMTDVGLLVVTGGLVTLDNVTATDNGGNGVEVYSLYTFACFGGNNIVVNVDNGTFAGNGEHGLLVVPGATGTLNFTGAQTYLPANGLADFLLDLADPDCTKKPHDDEVPGEEKEPNVVEVPETGGDPVEQDCEAFSSNILQLPNGTWVEFGCPFEGFNLLEGLTEDQLPGTLGAGADFLYGLSIGLFDPDMVEIIFNEDGTITIVFLLPDASNARGYDILYWDPAANNGQGSWVTLPQSRFGGGATALNPEDPTDGRRVKSGVREDGRSMSVTVNFTGVFVLVAR